MEYALVSSFTVCFKKGEDLKQAATLTQGDQETIVQYCDRFEAFLPYVDVVKELEDGLDTFMRELKSTLVGGAGLKKGTVTIWPGF